MLVEKQGLNVETLDNETHGESLESKRARSRCARTALQICRIKPITEEMLVDVRAQISELMAQRRYYAKNKDEINRKKRERRNKKRSPLSPLPTTIPSIPPSAISDTSSSDHSDHSSQIPSDSNSLNSSSDNEPPMNSTVNEPAHPKYDPKRRKEVDEFVVGNNIAYVDGNELVRYAKITSVAEETNGINLEIYLYVDEEGMVLLPDLPNVEKLIGTSFVLDSNVVIENGIVVGRENIEDCFLSFQRCFFGNKNFLNASDIALLMN